MSLLELGMSAGVGLIVLAIYLFYRQPVGKGGAGGPGYGEQERRFQPTEIANGILVMSEQYLRCDLPRRMGARADQVYLTPEGMLVPVDTKTGTAGSFDGRISWNSPCRPPYYVIRPHPTNLPVAWQRGVTSGRWRLVGIRPTCARSCFATGSWWRSTTDIGR